MIEKDPSDKYLIEQYLSGDTSSLPILVKRWHKIFCEKAYWILRDKDLAKDVAQECWIIIIHRLSALKKADSFKSWALRIIYTKSIDAYKRRSRELQAINKIDKKDYAEVDEKEHQAALKSKLLNAIQDLSKEKQDIIRLFYVEEYSLQEISFFLKIPIGTVKSRLFKAREKLKSIIKLKS